jgi:hypothetical protein
MAGGNNPILGASHQIEQAGHRPHAMSRPATALFPSAGAEATKVAEPLPYAGKGAAAGRAFKNSSAKRALRLRPAEIASTPVPK